MAAPATARREFDDDGRLDAAVLGHLERLRAGDRAAMADILALVRPHLIRYVRYRMSSLGTAYEDVAQEACLALVKAVPTYRWDGKPFLAFVYGIAGHKVADAFRARGRDRADLVADPLETADTEAGPEQSALDAELRALAGSLIATLPAAQREILRLRVMAGMSAGETAAAVGSTPGAVRVAQHRALTALRRRLLAARADHA